MKRVQGQSEITFNSFGFDVLTNAEMNKVRGGEEESRPKTRPKDIFDFEEN